MGKLIEQVRSIMKFHTSPNIGNLVIIVNEPNKTSFYGRIQNFTRDHTKKDEWWEVEFLILTVPPIIITWKLRTPQFSGKETFTMNGEEIFIAPIDLSSIKKYTGKKGIGNKEKAEVIDLFPPKQA